MLQIHKICFPIPIQIRHIAAIPFPAYGIYNSILILFIDDSIAVGISDHHNPGMNCAAGIRYIIQVYKSGMYLCGFNIPLHRNILRKSKESRSSRFQAINTRFHREIDRMLFGIVLQGNRLAAYDSIILFDSDRYGHFVYGKRISQNNLNTSHSAGSRCSVIP